MKPDGSKYKILLVEDDTNLSDIYKLRLEAEGFDVKQCIDGEQALQVAIQYHPDLILLDLMMPKISGFDVLDILRQTPETAHTKIIVLTALSRPDDQTRAKELGADEFLTKSQIVISDIVERIKQHLGVGEVVAGAAAGSASATAAAPLPDMPAPAVQSAPAVPVSEPSVPVLPTAAPEVAAPETPSADTAPIPTPPA